jgi:hypothetical protein
MTTPTERLIAAYFHRNEISRQAQAQPRCRQDRGRYQGEGASVGVIGGPTKRVGKLVKQRSGIAIIRIQPRIRREDEGSLGAHQGFRVAALLMNLVGAYRLEDRIGGELVSRGW